MTDPSAYETLRVEFPNADGLRLAARLERPVSPVKGHALFAHCFTCSKDIAAATRLSRALTEAGLAVLRFDFTGIGNSEGDFANTNFSSNIEDLLAAAEWLESEHGPARLLIGHSFGGSAVLAAAPQIDSVRGVATIAAPSDPGHIQVALGPVAREIERRGVADVRLGGRRFTLKRQFLEDLGAHGLETAVRGMRDRAVLVFHAPSDAVVPLEHGLRIFEAARQPKTFVALEGADHLLSRPEDSRYVASVLGAWARRFLTRGSQI